MLFPVVLQCHIYLWRLLLSLMWSKTLLFPRYSHKNTCLQRVNHISEQVRKISPVSKPLACVWRQAQQFQMCWATVWLLQFVPTAHSHSGKVINVLSEFLVMQKPSWGLLYPKSSANLVTLSSLLYPFCNIISPCLNWVSCRHWVWSYVFAIHRHGWLLLRQKASDGYRYSCVWVRHWNVRTRSNYHFLGVRIRLES